MTFYVKNAILVPPLCNTAIATVTVTVIVIVTVTDAMDYLHILLDLKENNFFNIDELNRKLRGQSGTPAPSGLAQLHYSSKQGTTQKGIYSN